MATLRAAVKATLLADSTLMSILTGGLNDFEGYGRLGLTPSNAAYAADGITLLPQAVLTWGTETPALDSYGLQGMTRTFQLWVYDHDSPALIETALNRARIVLHRLQLTTDDARQVLILFANHGPDFVADELQGAAGRFSRYWVRLSRR